MGTHYAASGTHYRGLHYDSALHMDAEYLAENPDRCDARISAAPDSIDLYVVKLFDGAGFAAFRALLYQQPDCGRIGDDFAVVHIIAGRLFICPSAF